jgi:hypothetical protein
LALKGFNESAKRILGKLVDVGQDATPPIRRNRVKLFCGGALMNIRDQHG